MYLCKPEFLHFSIRANSELHSPSSAEIFEVETLTSLAARAVALIRVITSQVRLRLFCRSPPPVAAFTPRLNPHGSRIHLALITSFKVIGLIFVTFVSPRRVILSLIGLKYADAKSHCLRQQPPFKGVTSTPTSRQD